MKKDGPRLQNIPIRTEEGKKLRAAFAAAQQTILTADYTNLELHVMAAILLEKKR